MSHSKENTLKTTKRSSLKISQVQPYNSNYQSSETIVKSILDKIMTLSFYEAFSKETDKNLGDFCYDHIKKEITSFFELNFINYTNSDNNTDTNTPELLWEMEPQIENTWVEILEPESEPIDRYESAQILYQEIKRDNDHEKNNNNNNQTKEKERKKSNMKTKNKNIPSDNKNRKVSDLNNNIISEVEEKSSISGFEGEVKIEKGDMLEVSGIEDKYSEGSNQTDAEIKKNIENVPEITEHKINEVKNQRKEEKKTTKRNSAFLPVQLPPVIRKNRNSLLFNYPSIDIPGLEQEFNHQNLEPSNVDNLRQERDELIKKKLLEEKTEKNNNKVKRINVDNDKRPKKIFDAKHLTFDSNGNIINFHPYKLEKLKQEFTLIKNLIKGEPNKENSKQKTKNNYLTYRGNKKESSKNNNDERKGKELIIEKPEQIFEDKLTKDKERYIPSGSNFQIISPNIGVSIKENNKFKQGPKEFSKYFQKYSIRDYDKMLNDFVPLQNKTLIQNKLKKLNSSSSYDYMTTIPNNTTKLTKKPSNNLLVNSFDLNNNTNNNPLLTDAQAMNISNNANNSNNNINLNINTSLSNNNPLLSSNFKTINYNNNNSNYKSINTENSIVMKKLGMGSLKLEIDNLKDLSTINPDILNRTNRTKNIFRYNSYKDYKKYRTRNIDTINVFSELNKKIMNTRDWGNESTNKKNVNTETGFNEDNGKRYARHITKQQVLRELGSNILSGIKIRLPRDRKVDINDNNIN